MVKLHINLKEMKAEQPVEKQDAEERGSKMKRDRGRAFLIAVCFF